MTTRALLLYPDVYHVGVSTSQATDFYSIAAMPIEPWMGLQENNKAGYEYGDNIRVAGNLKGKLLMIHGTSDVNAPFSGAMRLADAFIRAGKSFDMMVLPEQPHLFEGPSLGFWIETLRKYFQEHLKP